MSALACWFFLSRESTCADMVASSADFGLYRKYQYAPSSSTAATPIAASVCSRLVMFAPIAILTHRRDYEWNRFDCERRRRLALRLQCELGYFLTFRLHEVGPRQLHVLDERRCLEGLHEPRQRLDVDCMPDDFELDRFGVGEERVGAGLLGAVPLHCPLTRRLVAGGIAGGGGRALLGGIGDRHALRQSGLGDLAQPRVLRQRVGDLVHQMRPEITRIVDRLDDGDLLIQRIASRLSL